MAAKVRLHFGILMGGHGPTYETAAEVRMASALGDRRRLHEHGARGARGGRARLRMREHLVRDQQATGLSAERLTHADVTVVADRAASRLRAVLDEFMKLEGG